MRKVYAYLNSHPDAVGVIVIDNIDYMLTKNPSNIRYSQIPEVGGVYHLEFGVWIIRPSEDVYYKVELFFVH